MKVKKPGRASANRRGRKGKSKSVECKINLSNETIVKLMWLAEINHLSFPDDIPEMIERYYEGSLFLGKKGVRTYVR